MFSVLKHDLKTTNLWAPELNTESEILIFWIPAPLINHVAPIILNPIGVWCPFWDTLMLIIDCSTLLSLRGHCYVWYCTHVVLLWVVVGFLMLLPRLVRLHQDAFLQLVVGLPTYNIWFVVVRPNETLLMLLTCLLKALVFHLSNMVLRFGEVTWKMLTEMFLRRAWGTYVVSR